MLALVARVVASPKTRAADFLSLLLHAAQMPPHRALVKAVRYTMRETARRKQRRWDYAHGTYLPIIPGLMWRARLALASDAIAPHWHVALKALSACYCTHRFDILGSGFVSFDYTAETTPDRKGDWLKAQVNPSNLAQARAIWSLIEAEQYRPIDWQKDVRSGYRWRGDRHFSEQPIPIDLGADVKVPWEMGRLQHLPRLAICAILSQDGVPGFEPPAYYASELTNQLLDFLALNPPRMGANWMCPMDIGIRAVNMIVALDLLHTAGVVIRQPVIDVAMSSVREHAEHILAHLEWSERGRSNHYLANLVGLLWAATSLPSEPRIDSVLAATAREFVVEADLQFAADGGNYEGSTNYHRLSGEIVLFGTALLAGTTAEERIRIETASPLGRNGGPLQQGHRREQRTTSSDAATLPPHLLATLQRACELTRVATRPDGKVTQIGDTDSGRLLKLDPVGMMCESPSGSWFCEDALNHTSFATSVEALFGGATAGSIEAGFVHALTKGRRFPASPAPRVADHGDLGRVIMDLSSLPYGCARYRRIDFDAAQVWERAAYPEFGLYIFRSASGFIAFRCAPAPPPSAPLGHTHDDNLSIEYVLGSHSRIDPGSYCYTPSLATRDIYRSATAHDVVRAVGWELATMGSDPFAMSHVAWARCTAWQEHGVAGEVTAPQGTLRRALRIGGSCLEIWDGVSPPNRLRPLSEPVPVASGYGRLELQAQLA